MIDAALALAAYLLGAIPFGVIVAARFAGVDVRSAGSGNIGATNVARTAGKKLGVLVLGLDALKALLPTLAARLLVPGDANLHALVGGAAVLGHVFSVYLKFRGGKGVASALGALIVLAPLATLGGLIVFGATWGITRFVSLGSLLGAVTSVALAWILRAPLPYAICATGITLLIVARHRGNILRLINRSESKL